MAYKQGVVPFWQIYLTTKESDMLLVWILTYETIYW